MHRFKNILYVHETESDAARATLELAVQLARQNNGQLRVLFVLESSRTFAMSGTLMLLRARALDFAEKSLASFVGQADTDVIRGVRTVEGKPHIEIVRAVLRHNYDLVIKPIAPTTLIERLLGQIDLRLLRHCPCPVWVSRGEVHGEFDTVLAAVDCADPRERDSDDALNQQILELAYSLCERRNAQLHIGHAWYPPFLSAYKRKRAGFARKDIDEYINNEKKYHRNWLNRLLRKARNWIGAQTFAAVERHTHLPMGYAGQDIPRLAEKFKADVVVMGTVARSGISGLVMGNTAEQILDQMPCSVLAVKPPGFVSLIKLED